jgi:hypothetical protein
MMADLKFSLRLLPLVPNSKEAPKIIYGRKKLDDVKWQNLEKSSRKEAEKYFYKHLGEKSYDMFCYTADPVLAPDFNAAISL